MMRELIPKLCVVGLLAGASFAQADTPAGWVISMVWSPQYCRDNPALGAREPQCLETHDFELGSLQPLNAADNNTECSTEALSPELAERGMWVLPNKAALRKTWRQHGACSGLAMDEYLMQIERAHQRVAVPLVYRDIAARLPISRAALVASFLRENEGLQPGQVIPVCAGHWLREVRVCVTADFQFERCGVNLPDQCPDQIELRPHPVLRAHPARKVPRVGTPALASSGF